MHVLFYGGRPAGVTALHAVRQYHDVVLVVPEKPPYGVPVREYAIDHALRTFDGAVNDDAVLMADADVLLCVHGRRPLGQRLLTALSCINLHPCLSVYPGADPIGRLLQDGGTMASVGAHRMTQRIDGGPVLLEEFIDIQGCTTREEVYARLQPLYADVATKVLDIESEAGA